MGIRPLISRGGALGGLTRIVAASVGISVLAAAWAPAAPAALAATGDSTTGSGTYQSGIAGPDGLVTFSLTVTGGTGSGGLGATGTATVTRAGLTVTAAIYCLWVDGNDAIAVGRVTASNVPDTVGSTLDLSVEDNGTPGSGLDRFNGFGISSADPVTQPCNVGYGWPQRAPILTGEIVVVDTDMDDDGVTDTADNCPTVANSSQANNDDDTLGDACDPDDDNDGVADAIDAFPLDPIESADTDGDLVGDVADNCPAVSNADQSDVDSDGIGDACDPVDDRDADGDGVLDTSDNCPAAPNADQRDTDRDGIGDACDADDDGDGALDHVDNCALHANPDQADLDADGVGDRCDPTDDRTAAQQLADLITQLQTSPAGPGNSYMAKLQGIADSVAEGDTKGACSKLAAFENEVAAQTGKKLTQSDADALLRESAAIKTKAGCS